MEENTNINVFEEIEENYLSRPNFGLVTKIRACKGASRE
jgi:hypothetical protein